MENSSIFKTGSKSITLEYFGSVRDVIEGKITKEAKTTYFEAKEFNLGFECASPIDYRSLGESVLVNDRCFTKSTQADSEQYKKIIYGHEFISSGFVFISSCMPTHLAKMEEGYTDLDTLLIWLFDKIRTPFVISGFIKFERLNGIYIVKPPIENKNIFENKEVYYPDKIEEYEDVYGYVIGVVSDPTETRLAELNQKLRVCLYENPIDSPIELIKHIHVLTLAKKSSHKDQIIPGNVTDCLHLVSKNTKIKGFDLELYTIDDVSEIKPIKKEDQQ
ncbi:MAG: hypothetical protein FJZ57_02440 [Chlamydiae bacterium]|nr:hypothetical protein [Chlamydiota bacterium]